MRAPGCGLCPKLQDEADCDINQDCNRDFHKTNNWCIGDDCYLDPLDGSCKENVCVSITMVPMHDADDLHWTLGACSPSLQYKNGMVKKEKDCCLAPGNHTLACYNRREPHGWKKSFIVINGERYCDDFIGYNAMRRIVIRDSKNDQFDERIHTSFNITHASSISSWSTYKAGMKGCRGEGKGLLGNSVQYLGLEECKRSCEDTANCNSITWNSRDNRCYLKNKLDVCDDRSCAWGRNNAIDWNFYWKTCDVDCPWLSSTDVEDGLECGDGDLCNVRDSDLGWDCCQNKGRNKCPANFPVMCAINICGKQEDEYCCAESGQQCKDVYHSEARSCDSSSKLSWNINNIIPRIFIYLNI